MSKFDSRSLFLILAVILAVGVWSCDQPVDVVAPKSLTNLWLNPERLPTPPDGMAYELWVAKNPLEGNDIPANEVISLGRFSYVSDDTIIAFLDLTGNLRADSNLFVLPQDLFSFASLFITVEDASTQGGSSPGPIMLEELITGRSDTLKLNFPLSEGKLWDAIVRFNMEGVTDGNRFQGDGYGVWFSSYQYRQLDMLDTVAASPAYLVAGDDPVVDTVTGDTTFQRQLDSVWYESVVVLSLFGDDTLAVDVTSPSAYRHRRLIRHVDSTLDDVAPFQKKTLSDDNFTTESNLFNLDIFTQDDFALPNYQDWGWAYQGWVISDELPDDIPTGAFNPPAWRYKDGQGNNLIPGDGGGLLATGRFYDITKPDLENPYTFSINLDTTILDSQGNPQTLTIYRQPQIPGEDFLDGAALAAAGITNTGPINLLPFYGGSSYGSVFISLEPTNMVNRSANFPLLAFIRELPDSYSGNSTDETEQQTLLNWTGHVPGSNSGFPQVDVVIRRF